MWCRCFWLLWKAMKILRSATKFAWSTMTAQKSKRPKNIYSGIFFGGGLNDNVQSPWDLCWGDEEEWRWKTWICSKESVQLLGGRSRGDAIIEFFRSEQTVIKCLKTFMKWLRCRTFIKCLTHLSNLISHPCPDFQAWPHSHCMMVDHSRFSWNRYCDHFLQNCSNYLLDHECNSEEEVSTNKTIAIFNLIFLKHLQ